MLYIAAMQTSNSDKKMIDELFLFLDNNNDGSLDKNEIIKGIISYYIEIRAKKIERWGNTN
jgi:Ca2+-binding EF-hand superfamily protein